jgi:Uma2 family endonuclease
MTLRQYLADTSDERKIELLDGEPIVSPRPRSWHQLLILYLGYLLDRWVRAHGLGWVWPEIDMILDQRKPLTYVPDIVFWQKNTENDYVMGGCGGQRICVWKSNRRVTGHD